MVVEAKDELILVKVDARLIMQVIINLLDNAIKYIHKNSEIIISFWKEEKKLWYRLQIMVPVFPRIRSLMFLICFIVGQRALQIAEEV